MNAALFLLTFACFSADPSGHWEGALRTQVGELAFEIDLAKNAAGDFAGALNQPSEHLKGLPLDGIAVDGQAIRFQVKGARDERAFQGEISADGQSISGDFRQSGYSVPFSLLRTGEAKMEPPVKNAAVGKELEGVWNGTLDARGKQVRAVLTLTNLPDGNATGSILTVDDGLEIPIATIAQKAANVTLDLQAVGASFSGSLNREGTELAGTYTRGPLSLPLTFRRSDTIDGKK